MPELTDSIRFEGGDDAKDIVSGLFVLHAGGAAPTAGAAAAGATAGLATQLGEHFAWETYHHKFPLPHVLLNKLSSDAPPAMLYHGTTSLSCHIAFNYNV